MDHNQLRMILRLSGLEPLNITPEFGFAVIGERTNITGSPKFSKLILAGDFDGALVVARQQVQGGANLLDVNMDEGMIDSEAAMIRFLNLIGSEPEIARIPIVIDSSKWSVIEAGLKCVQGKAVVNSISLKNGEEEFLRQARLIRRYGAATIVMAFDEQGQADNFQRKIDICARAYDLLTTQADFPANDIIFDPNILTVATGLEEHRNYAVDFIEATRWIKNNLPGARVSGGVSNISFSFRGNNTVREAMHAAFLFHAIRAGLDMGIVNAGQLAVYEEIEPELRERVEDVLLNRRDDATERLVEFAENVKAKGKDSGRRRSLAKGACRRTSQTRAGQRHHRLHRHRHRGSAPKMQAPARCDRRSAHGRDERGRRFVRLGQNVSAAGGEERAGDEKSCGLSDAVHGSGKICRREAAGAHRDGDGERRRARHRQEHRGRRAAM